MTSEPTKNRQTEAPMDAYPPKTKSTGAIVTLLGIPAFLRFFQPTLVRFFLGWLEDFIGENERLRRWLMVVTQILAVSNESTDQNGIDINEYPSEVLSEFDVYNSQWAMNL